MGKRTGVTISSVKSSVRSVNYTVFIHTVSSISESRASGLFLVPTHTHTLTHSHKCIYTHLHKHTHTQWCNEKGKNCIHVFIIKQNYYH